MRRLLPLLVLPIGAAVPATPPANVPRLIFPVVGQASYQDDFGDPRAGGPHQGIDILADRKAPAVAVEAGKVEFWTTSASAGCMLYLKGKSGTVYQYIHLNNDLGKRNDNRGTCVPGVAYAPGLANGASVSAGQQIGFVGDSGDANGIHPHLHFEVHPKGKAAVDPFGYLKRAQRLLFPAPRGNVVTLSLTGSVVATDGSSLTLSVRALQLVPGGLALKKVGRVVRLSLLSGSLGTRSAESLVGTDAVVLTVPETATLSLLLGRGLAVSRLSAPPGPPPGGRR